MTSLSVTNTDGSAAIIANTYDYYLGGGNNGRVQRITDGVDPNYTTTYEYDDHNRLSTVTATAFSRGYSYDAWGNLTNKTVMQNVNPPTCAGESLNAPVTYQNQFQNSVTCYDASGNLVTTATYCYDAAGNLRTDGSGRVYSFDQENRITGAGGLTYTYDADGNRVQKSNGSTGTIYWYMSPGIVAESDLSGNLKSEYVFFAGERVARKDFSGSTTSVFYYFSDHLKTASVITDSAGTVKADSDYYPWGGELQFVNNDPNHYKFTGKERDAETGLDYFGARYYSNWLGRFITPDWSATPEPVPFADLGDPQSLNQYSYVRNVPTARLDPDGHLQKKEAPEPPQQEAKEEAEQSARMESAREELERDRLREEADEIAEGKAKFRRENRDGYDDPVTGVCYARPPATSSVSAPGYKPKAEPPVFVELPEYTAGSKTIGLLGRPGSPGIPIFSGVNGPAQQMPKGTPGFNAYTRTHVEGHVAALMRLSGIKDATLVINNPRICIPCFQNLPSMLPVGSRLTVILPGGQPAVFYGNSR